MTNAINRVTGLKAPAKKRCELGYLYDLENPECPMDRMPALMELWPADKRGDLDPEDEIEQDRLIAFATVDAEKQRMFIIGDDDHLRWEAKCMLKALKNAA